MGVSRSAWSKIMTVHWARQLPDEIAEAVELGSAEHAGHLSRKGALTVSTGAPMRRRVGAETYDDRSQRLKTRSACGRRIRIQNRFTISLPCRSQTPAASAVATGVFFWTDRLITSRKRGAVPITLIVGEIAEPPNLQHARSRSRHR